MILNIYIYIYIYTHTHIHDLSAQITERNELQIFVEIMK